MTELLVELLIIQKHKITNNYNLLNKGDNFFIKLHIYISLFLHIYITFFTLKSDN